MMQQQAMNRELPVPYAPDETGYYMPREESREESRGEVWVYGEPVPGGQVNTMSAEPSAMYWSMFRLSSHSHRRPPSVSPSSTAFCRLLSTCSTLRSIPR